VKRWSSEADCRVVPIQPAVATAGATRGAESARVLSRGATGGCSAPAASGREAGPFNGQSPEVVLHTFVEHQLRSGAGEVSIFSIWGLKLIELWAAAIPAGERISFRGTEGVLPFLRVGAEG
jgi:hypothetical protein